MLKKKKILLLLLLFAGSLTTQAQHIGISTNAVYAAFTTLSAGVEVPLSRMTSIEAYGSVRPWKREADRVNKHWTAQAQFRIWPCQVMNGFFFGPYVHGGQFNVANPNMPFKLLKGLGDSRYEGWLVGGGLGIGYEYALARHWNLGAEIGAGYTYIDYKKYNCEVCGTQLGNGKYNYWGISRLGLSIIYVF